MKLWEGLSQDLNYNVMFHSVVVWILAILYKTCETSSVASNANRLNGIDGEVLDAQQIKEIVPVLDCLWQCTLPDSWCVLAATCRCGTSWCGGVGFCSWCWCTRCGFDPANRSGRSDYLKTVQLSGVRTAQYGEIRADKVGCVVAGNSSLLAKMGGFWTATRVAFRCKP